MAWVRVTKDFDYLIPGKKGRALLAFKAGSEVITTQDAVDAIVKAKAGEAINRPRDKTSDKSGKTVFLKDDSNASKASDA